MERKFNKKRQQELDSRQT